MMDARNSESLTERGELYLCLARAFMTPLDAASYAGLRDALPQDLDELGASLGYDWAEALPAYRAAIGQIDSHASLLGLYSSVFLAPPRTVQLNTGTYLDGALNGGAVLAMETLYRSCGVERGAHFRDFPDHISVQLEFVAWLYLRQAESTVGQESRPAIRPEHFLHDYVARWLPPFVADLEEEIARRGESTNPWLALARLLAVAVAHDAQAPEIAPAELRAQRAIDQARQKRAERGVTDADMAFIAARLREKGLSTDHLAIPPEQRDEAAGYTRKQPPTARRGSRYG